MLIHCVEEFWWNMPFQVTQHGDGVVGDAFAMSTKFVTMDEWINELCITIIKIESPRIHNHDLHPLKNKGIRSYQLRIKYTSFMHYYLILLSQNTTL